MADTVNVAHTLSSTRPAEVRRRGERAGEPVVGLPVLGSANFARNGRAGKRRAPLTRNPSIAFCSISSTACAARRTAARRRPADLGVWLSDRRQVVELPDRRGAARSSVDRGWRPVQADLGAVGAGELADRRGGMYSSPRSADRDHLVLSAEPTRIPMRSDDLELGARSRQLHGAMPRVSAPSRRCISRPARPKMSCALLALIPVRRFL